MKRSWPSLVARELQLPEWWKSRADSTALSTRVRETRGFSALLVGV